MCSAIITRNLFVVNAVHTVLQDLCYTPGQPKLSVTKTDRLDFDTPYLIKYISESNFTNAVICS